MGLLRFGQVLVNEEKNETSMTVNSPTLMSIFFSLFVWLVKNNCKFDDNDNYDHDNIKLNKSELMVIIIILS